MPSIWIQKFELSIPANDALVLTSQVVLLCGVSQWLSASPVPPASHDSGIEGGGSYDLIWPQDLCTDWRQACRMFPLCS